jgi:hypothetical protein
MESRLYHSDDLEAVEPFLRAAMHQTRLDLDTRSALQPLLLPASELSQMVSSQVLPIWFESGKAARSYADLNRSIESGEVARTSGALVYLASLAVAAENYGLADQLISEIRSRGSAEDQNAEWTSLIDANRQLSSGEAGRGRQILKPLFEGSADQDNASAIRAVALYLAGAHPDLDNLETQMLNLLSVPAIYGDRYPRLSAAALYMACSISREKSDPKQVRILVNELLRRYPNTYHGRLAAIEK